MKTKESCTAKVARCIFDCGGDTEITNIDLAKAAGVSLRQVFVSLTKLEKNGMIKRQQFFHEKIAKRRIIAMPSLKTFVSSYED